MNRLALFLVAFCAFGADLTGVWTGQQQGRNGQMEDVAFRFKLDGQTLSGKLFGDEFDIPISDATLSAEAIRFKITATNYYTGSKVVYTYTGTVKGNEMELVRERVQTPEEKSSNRPASRQTIKLRKL